jgi:hypothetical protein
MMNWKGFGRKQSWPNFNPGIDLEGPEKKPRKTSVRIADLQAEI